jgi:hypothetical protein
MQEDPRSVVPTPFLKEPGAQPNGKKGLATAQCYAHCQLQKKRSVIRPPVPESADFLCHVGLIVKLSTSTPHDFINPRIFSTYEIMCASVNMGIIKAWKEIYSQS